MLEHLTAGVYKSGIHRVVCKPGIERFSCPFFGHRVDNASIIPLDQFTGYDREKFSFLTEGQFFNHRLTQINLKK